MGEGDFLFKKYVDYEHKIDSSALFPMSSRPTSNDWSSRDSSRPMSSDWITQESWRPTSYD